MRAEDFRFQQVINHLREENEQLKERVDLLEDMVASLIERMDREHAANQS